MRVLGVLGVLVGKYVIGVVCWVVFYHGVLLGVLPLGACVRLGSENIFLLLVGAGSCVGRVRVRFGIVLRLPARKTLYMSGREGAWCASDAVMGVSLGAVCVGGFRGVLWLGILMRFTRGDGGGR
jgi:hypothetical protein